MSKKTHFTLMKKRQAESSVQKENVGDSKKSSPKKRASRLEARTSTVITRSRARLNEGAAGTSNETPVQSTPRRRTTTPRRRSRSRSRSTTAKKRKTSRSRSKSTTHQGSRTPKRQRNQTPGQKETNKTRKRGH